MARLKKGPIVVLGVLVAAFVTNCRMNGVAESASQVLAHGGNVAVGSSTGTFGGQIEWSDVAVWPEVGSETTEAARADEVHMKTPGIGWMLGAAFSGFRADPSNRDFRFPDELVGSAGKGAFSGPPGLDSFELKIVNLKLDRDATATFLPKWLGFNSLAPFDALGCALNSSWRHDDISGVLGLPKGFVQVDVSITNPDGNIAEVVAAFTREGVSNATYRARYDMPDGFYLGSLEFDDAKLKEASWTIEDQGFVAARNAACASLIGLREKRYLQIHLTALRRELLAAGLIPDQALEDAYAGYLAKGGTLTFNYRPAADYKQQLSAGLDLQSRAKALGLSVGNGGDPVPMSFFAVTPGEWSEELRAATITNLINQAKALDDRSLVLVDESTTSLMENLLLVESTTAVVDASELPFANAISETTIPAEGEGDTAEGEEGEDVGEILVQKIPYEELPKAIGQKVVITTTFGSRREGVLKSANNAGITVYTNLRGTFGDMNIPRADVAGAEVHWDSVKTQ